MDSGPQYQQVHEKFHKNICIDPIVLYHILITYFLKTSGKTCKHET
jgi:hypothetical protein